MNRGIIVVLGFLGLAGCLDFKSAKPMASEFGQLDTLPAIPASEIRFTDIQKYVLLPSCVRCHSGTKPAGDIDFSNYASTTADDKVVKRGNPQGSSLYTEIATGDMPDGGAALAPPYAQLVYDWIQAGAVEAPSPSPSSSPGPIPAPSPAPSPRPSPLPPSSTPVFADIQNAVLIPSCIKCHGGTHPDGKINLSSYAAILAKPKVVNPGNPQGSSLYTEIATGSMPKRAGHLSATLIHSVYAWIKAGAPEKADARE